MRGLVVIGSLAVGIFGAAAVVGLVIGLVDGINGDHGHQQSGVLNTALNIAIPVGAFAGLAFGFAWRGRRWRAWQLMRTAAKAAATTRPLTPSSGLLKPVVALESRPASERSHPATAQPSAWPTMLTTLLLTPLVGWIPALIQGRRARSIGADEAYYWKAFAAAVVVSVLLGVALRLLASR